MTAPHTVTLKCGTAFYTRRSKGNEIDLEYIPTNEQVADILIKCLFREKHEKFSAAMGQRRAG
jgi:hypothetical protein